MKNPALRSEPRHEPAGVIPITQESSLLDWLESSNRIIFRESVDPVSDGEEDVEINELMDVDDNSYDDVEDDSGSALED